MKISKKSRPGLILAVVAVAAAGVLLYSYKAHADEQPPPPPLPGGGGGGGGSSDTVLQTSGGKMTTQQAQLMLKSMGPAAHASAMTNLVVDGVYGPQTKLAVQYFQSLKGLVTTGVVSPQVADTLALTYQKFKASGGTSFA